VLQNPAGGSGDLEIRRNNDVILRTNPSHFAGSARDSPHGYP
jgi:hypothetical protein